MPIGQLVRAADQTINKRRDQKIYLQQTNKHLNSLEDDHKPNERLIG